MRFMIDAHLDLAMNQVLFERDITRSVEEINQAEQHLVDVKFRGRATVSLPEMRASRLGICITTLLARSGPEHRRKDEYRRTDLDYVQQSGAFCCCHAQLAYYHLLEQQGEFRLLKTQAELDEHLALWESATETAGLPVGAVLSMEGADPILNPEQLPYWWDLGLRAIGPAHYGHSHYAGGTGVTGPLTERGRRLVQEMDRLGMALDVTHLCDESMDEAFDLFTGMVWASHHNCRTLVNWDRQLTDRHIQQLIDRDAVIGAALDAIMLYDGWRYGETDPSVLDITSVADHIDHICQMAGSTRHCGIGTDLDGGYGTEQTPRDLKTIKDVHKLEDILSQRGYSDEDIDGIFWKNWLRLLRQTLP